MSNPLTVLIARSAFDDIYEPAWHRALNEIGIRCRLFDAHAFTGAGPVRMLQERLLWGPGVRRANRELVRAVRNERPDVTLLYQGRHFTRETVEAIRPLTFVAGYHNDDPTGPRRRMFRYRHLLRALPLYHGYHVFRECNVAEFLAAGVPRVKLLMFYYLPWLHYPRRLEGEDAQRWTCDVLFAGHPEPDIRVAYLSAAAKAGLDVRIYGHFWRWRFLMARAAEFSIPIGPLLAGDDYARAICGARVCACFFSRWNRDQYTIRVFEIPACGAFLLAERTPVMLQLYEEGREAEYFSSVEEFVDKARFYALNDVARRKIAEAGYRRCMSSGYDVYSRMRQWLRDIEEWRRP
ncbi:MAG: glycosyltransferase [Planctomycetota bacterium]|nr:glycosyltransferase [Planctomycetota bacterium]